jgi:hypothetical protein
MNNESTNKILCRKCGGPHFTIKCGKDKPIPVPVESAKEETLVSLPVKEYKEYKEYKDYNKHERREKYIFKKTYRVKLSELPKDIYDEELMELTYNWGHIIKVKVINYDENSVAYIDFGFEDEATYFIEAIDKTPFESLLLSASMVDSY